MAVFPDALMKDKWRRRAVAATLTTGLAVGSYAVGRHNEEVRVVLPPVTDRQENQVPATEVFVIDGKLCIDGIAYAVRNSNIVPLPNEYCSQNVVPNNVNVSVAN